MRQTKRLFLTALALLASALTTMPAADYTAEAALAYLANEGFTPCSAYIRRVDGRDVFVVNTGLFSYGTKDVPLMLSGMADGTYLVKRGLEGIHEILLPSGRSETFTLARWFRLKP